MTLPPRPWSYIITAPIGKHEGSGHVYIADATGRKIMNMWGTPDEKIALANLVITASETPQRSNHGESSEEGSKEGSTKETA